MKNTVVLDGFESHITLYAKGWYQKRENLNETIGMKGVIEDLKTIIGKIAGIDLEHVDLSNVLNVMTDVLCEIMKLESHKRTEQFIKDIFRLRMEPLTPEEFVERILGFLSTLKCKDRRDGIEIDIGKPNPEILPLTKTKLQPVG